MFSDLVVENKPTEKNEEMQPKKDIIQRCKDICTEEQMHG